MLFENSIRFNLEDVGRSLSLGQTTRGVLEDTKEYFNKAPQQNIYFVSGTFPNNYSIKIRGKSKQWLACSQIQQYNYINNILTNYKFETDNRKIIVVYEQTRNGLIHYHMLVHTDIHKHDFRALLAEMFGFTKSHDILININIVPITDVNKAFDYLLNKKTKEYEVLDWKVFKPLISQITIPYNILI